MIEVASLLKKEGIPGDLFTHRIFSQEVNYEANSFQGYKKEEREGYGLRAINPEGKLGFYAFNRLLNPQEAVEKALEVSQLGDRVDFLFLLIHLPGNGKILLTQGGKFRCSRDDRAGRLYSFPNKERVSPGSGRCSYQCWEGRKVSFESS